MNDNETFICANIAAHYLAEIDHWIEVLRNVVIGPVFEMQLNDASLFIFL